MPALNINITKNKMKYDMIIRESNHQKKPPNNSKFIKQNSTELQGETGKTKYGDMSTPLLVIHVTDRKSTRIQKI